MFFFMDACDTLFFGSSAAMGRVLVWPAFVHGGPLPGLAGPRRVAAGGIVWSFAATRSHPRGGQERAGDKQPSGSCSPSRLGSSRLIMITIRELSASDYTCHSHFCIYTRFIFMFEYMV